MSVSSRDLHGPSWHGPGVNPPISKKAHLARNAKAGAESGARRVLVDALGPPAPLALAATPPRVRQGLSGDVPAHLEPHEDLLVGEGLPRFGSLDLLI